MIIYGIAVFACSFASLSTIYLTFTSPPKYSGGELRETQTNKSLLPEPPNRFLRHTYFFKIKFGLSVGFHAGRFRVGYGTSSRRV